MSCYLAVISHNNSNVKIFGANVFLLQYALMRASSQLDLALQVNVLCLWI